VHPKLIHFNTKGSSEIGYLNIASINDQLPFIMQRVFWVRDTPLNIKRGRHAHYETEMVLVALQGEIEVSTISSDGSIHSFLLNKSNEGLFIPKLVWHEMIYSEDAIQLVISSTLYDENDYIRNKVTFMNIVEHKKTI
jgi:hypothetical protein